MTHKRIKKWLETMVFIIGMLVIHGVSWADQIVISGDKLSVQAGRTPMRELMRQLAVNYDVIIRMDPDINPLITITFQNRELEDGLKAILKPHNHVLVWKSVAATTDGSTARYKLSEIHIFKPGQKDRMVNIGNSQETEKPEPEAGLAPDLQTEPEPEPKTEPETETETEAETETLPQTRVIIKDNKVLVPVILGYGNNEAKASLIFDTGAGSIVLHENIARQLGIEEGRASEGEGVGGFKITTHLARLDYVQVGPHKKENLRADIIAYRGAAEADYNGLLGMNFIRGLKYTIDFNEQVIKWMP